MTDGEMAIKQARSGLDMLGEPNNVLQPAFSLAVMAVAWKGRAEKAEARVKKLKEALKPFADFATFIDQETSLQCEPEGPLSTTCPQQSPTFDDCWRAQEVLEEKTA